MRVRSLLIVLTLGLFGCETVELTEHRWRELQTDHFTIVSNAGDNATAKLAEELERFRALAIHVTGIEPFRDHIPTKVFLFGDFSSYYEFNGGAAIMGYMWPTLRANYIVVGPGLYFMDQRRIVFHEYVHYLLRNQRDRVPAWYDEGLAQMLSQVEDKGDHYLIGSLSRERMRQVVRLGSVLGREAPEDDWDVASRRPVYGLARRWRIPIDELMARDDVLAMPYQERLAFYAQSWAIVHMLMVGHQAGLPDRSGELANYLQLLTDGASRRQAFETAFSFEDDTIKRDMRRYLYRRRLPGFEVARNAIHYDHRYQARALGSNEAARELGSLMLLYGPLRSGSAHALFQHALMVDPEDAAAAAGLGVALSHEDESFEAAMRFAARAVELEPDDPVVFLDAANVLLRSCGFSKDYRAPACRARLIRAKAYYERAIELRPQLPEGHAGLGVVLSRLDEEPERAIEHLTLARNMTRWLPQLNLELGRLYLRTGRIDDAVASLQHVVRWSRNRSIKRDAVEALSRLDSSLSAQRR